MSVPFAPFSVEAPGSFGLNKQRSDQLDPRWATEAKNAVFDDSGRMSARNGWVQETTTPIAGTPAIDQIAPFLKADGSLEIISVANNKIYTGTTTLTELTGHTTPTADNWKFVNFMDKIYGFQIGHTPITYDGTTIADIADVNAPQANEVLAAFGRIWAANTSSDKTTVWYSDIIDGTDWTTGTTGSVDLDLYLSGTDNVVALSSFNGYLIVFCANSIMVFENPEDPNAATFGLVETIRGVGCIARDSVQSIGSDILFLSDKGITSLGRVIQEKSMPFGDLSSNVRDFFKLYSDSESVNLIRSVYHPVEGFYLISFPTFDISFCFDVRGTLEDGTYRASYWTQISPTALAYVQTGANDSELYLGKAGVIGRYSGYLDNASTYTLSYRSPWLDFGDASRIKILKRLRAIVAGGYSYTLVFKYSFDYDETEYSISSVAISSGTPAEYGIAEYNIAEYSGSVSSSNLQVPLTNHGSVIKFGVDITISASPISLQRMTLYAKAGRML